MTPAPEDKAKELILKFYNGITKGYYDWTGISKKNKIFRDSKSSAIILCDEVLNLHMIDHMGRGVGETLNEKQFWTKVREAIEKM